MWSLTRLACSLIDDLLVLLQSLEKLLVSLCLPLPTESSADAGAKFVAKPDDAHSEEEARREAPVAHVHVDAEYNEPRKEANLGYGMEKEEAVVHGQAQHQ